MKSLQVKFDRQVTINAGAFDLVQSAAGGQSVVVGFTTALVNNKTVATLTFSGPAVETSGSLKDGRYNLTVHGTMVHDLFGVALDGDADGLPGGDFAIVGTPANGLFRLFGDVTGDGSVSATDFNGTGPTGNPPNVVGFRQAFGGTSFAFDFDGDGSVSTNDFIQFRQRFGGSI